MSKSALLLEPSQRQIHTAFLPAPPQHLPMDLWFIGLIAALAILTWGGVVLCARLLVQR
jgi:hypothetical protein